jgi:hypothetical protein
MASEDVEKKLRTEYDKVSSAGKGQSNLYWFMKQRFLNITRKDIVTFLKADEQYVLAQSTKPRVNKSVVLSVKAPDELWAIDSIDVFVWFRPPRLVDTVLSPPAFTVLSSW